MDIYDALVAKIKATPAITALIGTRLYPDEIPQGDALPAVYYQTISDVKDHHLTGQLELEKPMIQFTVQAATKNSAADVAEAIKTALVDYQGTISGVQIQYIRLENEIPSFYRASDGIKAHYTHDLEFQVFFVKE